MLEKFYVKQGLKIVEQALEKGSPVVQLPIPVKEMNKKQLLLWMIFLRFDKREIRIRDYLNELRENCLQRGFDPDNDPKIKLKWYEIEKKLNEQHF